jgi:IS4 transposase
LAASSFYERFSPALARFLKQVLSMALGRLSESRRRALTFLGNIGEVLCIDSTVIRLHDALEPVFPACRTNHTRAAVKLHTVCNVYGCGPRSVKITAERVHDGPVLRAGRWVKGRLLLFDLGYFRYQLFDAIGRHQGYFLTRLKDSANPTIWGLNQEVRGRSVEVSGVRLQEFKWRLKREIFDAQAELAFRRRPYRGKSHAGRLFTRIVGLRDDVHGGYHWYVTNLSPDQLPATDVGKLYAARWSIELLFRELKHCYHLESMPSAKPHIVEALLYAAVLTLLASRKLLLAACRWATLAEERVPFERWARLFVSSASDFLAIILDSALMARERERRLLPFLAREAPDPNVRRPLLLERAGLCAP